jgi:hypothetical protein
MVFEGGGWYLKAGADGWMAELGIFRMIIKMTYV